MKIPGIKGCYDKTGGLFYFARMCSKIRLAKAGTLPEDYLPHLGGGFDGRLCRYIGISYDDLKKQVLAGKTDEEALAWAYEQRGNPLNEEQILIFNSFLSKRGWRDDETEEYMPELIKAFGFEDDGKLLTEFDLIEMDEERWTPNQWSAAWK